ncbi:hypothetical protein BC940DRAFT_112644 [Gongronella butleri]|nr:hypothetical protein BC940DRAFT_112644 [Gongronella butleri]
MRTRSKVETQTRSAKDESIAIGQSHMDNVILRRREQKKQWKTKYTHTMALAQRASKQHAKARFAPIFARATNANDLFVCCHLFHESCTPNFALKKNITDHTSLCFGMRNSLWCGQEHGLPQRKKKKRDVGDHEIKKKIKWVKLYNLFKVILSIYRGRGE